MINSILAGIRYWQGSSDSILARRLLPILAGLAILAVSLACSTQARAVSTQAPAPILAKVSTPRSVPAVPEKAKTELRATVSALQSLNVREKPTRRSPGLGVLYSGDQVILTGECRAGWAGIRYRDGRAWVDGRYLSGDRCEAE